MGPESRERLGERKRSVYYLRSDSGLVKRASPSPVADDEEAEGPVGLGRAVEPLELRVARGETARPPPPPQRQQEAAESSSGGRHAASHGCALRPVES